MVSVIPFLYIFLFGMMVYYFRERIIPILTRFLWPVVVVYCVWMNLPSSMTGWASGVRYNVITSLLLMCVIMGFGYNFGKHRMKTDYSYSFYLYHMVVINVIYHMIVQNFSSILTAVVVLVIQVIIILILAYMSVNGIDKKISIPLERKVMKFIQ